MKNIFLVILGISFFGEISNCQNLIRVNNNPGIDADYTNLQDANDNASDGDTIYLEGSETEYAYAEITKSVTIIGPGYFLDENQYTQANKLTARIMPAIDFNTGASGSAIMGCDCYFIHINVSDIRVIRCQIEKVFFSGTIENILILQNYINGEMLEHGYGPNVITNSLISNNIIKGLIRTNSAGSLMVSNNIITNQYSPTDWRIDCYNSIIQNNIVAHENGIIATNSGNTITNNILASDGTNTNGNQYNVVMDDVFVDYNGTQGYSTDGKWQLIAGSPAIGAGVGNVDCGAYGGEHPYVLSGLPDLPHIYEASIPSTVNSNEGLTVTIKVKSGQ